MINRKTRICLRCFEKANYNFSNQTKPLYCLNHKKENMIIVLNKKN